MAISALKQPQYKMLADLTDAQLLYHWTPAQEDVETQKNGLQIESSPVRLDIDNRAFFNSIGLESFDTFNREQAAKGKAAVQEAMAKAGREGKMMMKNGATSAEMAKMNSLESQMSLVEAIPISKPELHWLGGDVQIKYTPDELNVSWEVGGMDYQYVPYQLTIKFVPAE